MFCLKPLYNLPWFEHSPFPDLPNSLLIYVILSFLSFKHSALYSKASYFHLTKSARSIVMIRRKLSIQAESSVILFNTIHMIFAEISSHFILRRGRCVCTIMLMTKYSRWNNDSKTLHRFIISSCWMHPG